MPQRPLFLVPFTLFLCLISVSVTRAGPSRKDADAAFKAGKWQMAESTAAGYVRAIRDFAYAARVYHALRDGKQAADALNEAGDCCDSIGEPQKALQYYQQALPLERTAGDKSAEAFTIVGIGAIYGKMGQPKKALQFYQQALQLRTAAGNKLGAAIALTNIGETYAGIGQPEKALRFYEQALPILKAEGDKDGEAETLGDIGETYAVIGQPEKALRFYEQALPILKAEGDRSLEAFTLVGIGLVYIKVGQPEKALPFLQQALTLRVAAGNKLGAALALGDIGETYTGIGQPEKALRFYQQALPMVKAAGNKSVEAFTLVGIGLVYDEIGYPEKALPFFQQALTLRVAAGNKWGAAIALVNIGDIYEETGQPEKALPLIQQALPLVKAAGDKLEEAATLTVAAEALHSLGRNDEARKDYEAALDAADAVIGSITQNDLKRSTTETFQYLYQSYIDFTLQRRNPADDRRALEISEKARSRALRDLLAGNRSQLPSASIKPPLGSAARITHTPVLEAAVPVNSTADTTRAVREAALRDGLDTVALSMPDLPVRTTTQANDFQADEAKLSAVDGPALVYHPLSKDLAIFVVEPSGEIHVARSAITPEDLDTLIEVAREEITSPDQYDPAETKATLRKLYDGLIKPAEPWLTAPAPGHVATLTLVPFGSLLQVPFAALMAPDGQYLIQEYAIRTAPSLTVLRYTRQRSGSLEKTAMQPLILGDPVMPAGFTPLPGAMAEANGVSAMLVSDHPILRVQADASEANFRKLAPAATDIHLATHGYVDELQPRLSGIILSASHGPEPEYERDGYLTVAEVFQLKLNARLITLSACDTGLGPAGADGVFGLQSAFLTAGAASLLSSLWDVSDTATAKLMTEFYHQMELDPTHDRAKALRAAQLSLLETPEFRQPEYWAAFQLTGEAR